MMCLLARILNRGPRDRLPRNTSGEQPFLWPRRLPVAAQYIQQLGRQHHVSVFTALCVRTIYVAMAVLLPAAEPLSVIMTTHRFLPFHRATTHCSVLACLYTRGVHLPESPYACDEAWEVRSTPHRLPKDTPTIRMQRLCCHQKAAQRCPIGVLLPWQHKFGEHIRRQNAYGSGLTMNKDLGAAVYWRDMRSHRTSASRGSNRERRPRICNASSLARGSPAGGAGKALGVAGNLRARSLHPQGGARPDRCRYRTRTRDPAASAGRGLGAARPAVVGSVDNNPKGRRRLYFGRTSR